MATFLLISTSIAISGCKKPHGDVLPPDKISAPRVEAIMVPDSSQVPQKVFLTVKDRIKWLGSTRVKSSLASFVEFEKLFPEIAAQIGRALLDCGSDSCLRSLILKIGFIANHTPVRPLKDFGVLEAYDAISLYFGVLSDHDASPDEKLGVLALMMLSLDVHHDLVAGNPSDVFYPNAPRSAGRVASQLAVLRADKKLQKPIDCFLEYSGNFDQAHPSQLSELRMTFD